MGLRENELQNRGMHCERAYVGGNWNNDLNCGPFYANLYNDPSNTNTNIGAALGLAIIGVFLIMQIVGEILEFKGKVVPEFVKIRKYFARKKQERQTMREMSTTIHDVKTVLNSVESHYSEDNIAKRDAWMKWVNDRAVVYDQSIEVLKEEMDKNTKITMSLYIESKRSSIISFASYCVCSDNPVTREQFKRVFRLYAEYEEIIKDNDLQNGEVDIAIRIIREAYENHLRNGSFVEDVRGY